MDLTKILSVLPLEPGVDNVWDALEGSSLGKFFDAMAKTPQNPAFHGEGDVFAHTRMVCEVLVTLPAYREQDERRRAELFLAALLHDVGKIHTTREEAGRLVSPNHSAVGSCMARELLWREYGLCGTREAMRFRETVCALIRWHMAPVHMLLRPGAERYLRKMAEIGTLADDFT